MIPKEGVHRTALVEVELCISCRSTPETQQCLVDWQDWVHLGDWSIRVREVPELTTNCTGFKYKNVSVVLNKGY